MDNESKRFVENHLCAMWCKLNIDKPSNWDRMVAFVAEDVEETSNYQFNGDFHSGDIEIAFRRFFELQN